MLYDYTLNEIITNINTGVEYEIALFYCLLKNNIYEQKEIMMAIEHRYDKSRVKEIISYTSTAQIEKELQHLGFTFLDASFETQNDSIGPADIIMYLKDFKGATRQIGLSVKYANACTLNVTGRNFITDSQIAMLRHKLPQYTDMYIIEMIKKYGDIDNWFRKRKPSVTTDAFIDLIRDEVIKNWPNVKNKTSLFSSLFHSDSPIDFWVVTYNDSGYILKTKPQTIDISRAEDVIVGKYQTSYVAFYLDGEMVGYMQVKFNNGFIEKCKKKVPDIIYQGVRMSYGQPFSSWNFSVKK